MIKIFRNSYLIFLLSFISSAHSKNIIIQTQNKDLQQQLEKIVHQHTKDQDVLDSKKIFKNITNYLIDHRYLQASVTIKNTKKQSLSFEIRNPVQYFFTFKGNEQVDKLILYSLIKNSDLFSNPYIMEAVKGTIIKYYKEKSYNDVQVQTHVKRQLSQNKIYIRFNITEGKRFIIQKINFSGALSQKSRYYKKFFKNYSNSVFNLKYFEEEKVKSYIQSMVYHLRQIGYVNAKIYHQEFLFNKNNVTINVILREGFPIHIQNIKIKGNKNISTKQIKETLQVKKGDSLNIIKIQNNVKKIIQLYHEKDFLKVSIDQSKVINIDSSSKMARIHIDIKENNVVILNEIIVQGNKDIESEYIKRISNLKKRDQINQDKINQATYFLEDSGLFSIVNVYFTPKKKNSITIEVQEGKFGFLRFKLGAYTKYQISTQLNMDLNKENLFGHNRNYFLLNTELGTNTQLLYNRLTSKRKLIPSDFSNLFTYNVSTSYIYSYFLNSRFNSKLTYTHKNEIFSLSKERVDWIRSHQISFNLDKKLSNTSHINWRVWNIEIGKSDSQNFQSMETSMEEEQIIAEMGFDVRVDKRDNILFPKKGFYFDFKTDYSSPYIGAYDNIHFVSTEIKSRYYLSLKRIVFAHAINGGFVQNLNNGQIPIRRYFILGGLNSLRGFDGKIQGDRIPRVSEFPIDNPVETKSFSSYYFLVKQEFRFPMYGNFLNGALFYDVGGVLLFSEKESIFSFGHSVGFGIHSMTALGPLVINIGFKIKPQPQENLFHLNWAMGAF